MSDLDFLASRLPAGWRSATVREVTTKVGSGATPRGGSSVYVAEGPAFVRSQNIYDHEFRSDGIARLTAEAADQLRGASVQPFDVLINITGDSILRTCVAPPEALPARVSQHVAIVRSNGQVDPGFLQKWFSLPAMKDFMLGHSAGGTRKAITKGHILGFPLPLPPIEEQRAIAATLGALDDKIESDRRAVSLLGELARAHFESALAAGEPEMVPLGDITEVVKGRSYKSVELQESETALVTLKSVDRQGVYRPDGLKPYIGDLRAEQVLVPGDVVVAQTDLTQGAEVVGRGVRVPADPRYTTLVASLDLAIVRPSGTMPSEYLTGLLTSESFRQHCRSHVTGTTVLHLAKDAIPTWRAPVVTPDRQASYAAVARPLTDRADALNAEVVTLGALRDALLPELLSGRMRVADPA